MKRILFSILLVLILIPYIVNAAECDTSKVYIESIGIENSTGEVVELEEATAKDKTVNLNLQMSTKDDEILYKVVLKNDSSEDYEINKNSININSDYLEYSLESDNNNIVKANSTKTIYLRVKYSKEVDSSKFVDGVYQDEITMKVNLKSDDTISNPKTGLSYVIVIGLIFIISGVSLFVMNKRKLSSFLIIVGFILLPIGARALCSCEIVVDSKVTIKTEDIFIMAYSCDSNYYLGGDIKYKIGMTFYDFSNSDYINNINDSDDQDLIERILNGGYGFEEHYFIYHKYYECKNDDSSPSSRILSDEELENNSNECSKYIKKIDLNENIKNKEEGTYIIRSTMGCPG